MNSNTKPNSGLRPSFTPLGMWAFSIGTGIGWGSFIVTCNTYLQKSGVLGTFLGLLIGMAVILVITGNLQYMIQSAPDAGGIYTFEKRLGGNDFGFLALWFVMLTYLAVLWANITSVPLFARFFLGDTFRFGFHYTVFGYDIWLGEALLSIGAMLLVGLLCTHSSRIPNRIMIVSSLAFSIGFTACAILAFVRHGNTSFSYSPLYIEGSAPFAQIVRIAAISPWAFIGFENISHFSEEYTFPLKKVRRILIGSVLITTALYLLVSLLSVSAYPPEYPSWIAYIRDMGNLEGIRAVPAFYAANHYLGKAGVTVLMLALFAVILTSLIGNMLALSRLLYAAGREGELPRPLAKLSEHGIPRTAIRAVLLVSAFIPFLGRTAIGWIVDVTTLGATIIYALISHAVYLSAKKEDRKAEKVTGILGFALMTVFALLLLIPGLLPFHAMETESYVLFIVWSVLGLAYFRYLVRRDHNREYGQRMIVWLILLLLVLFASMMWVSRATENAAEDAVARIYEYHQAHPSHDDDAPHQAEREAFLEDQARTIGSTNTLYTVVSLGLVLLSIGIMLINYRDNQQLGKRLSAAEDEAEAAKKIAKLKQSIGILLDNMPALCFYKDAETGVYIACNRVLAEHLHRSSPEEIIGRTDFELYEPEVAKHFTEVDRIALSMDAPYILFEEVTDASGKTHQFQTTKLKFKDENGRLCLLGISMDMTELEAARRETRETQEAYRQALSTGAIYESIVDALSKDYFNLYYIDLATEEYISYGSLTEDGPRTVEKRGENFFESSRENAARIIEEEDIDAFLEAFQKEKILHAIEAHGTFIMQYRLLIAGVPTYVNLKATCIPGDEQHMIIGINNVDAQIKDRMAARNAASERKTYLRLNALNNNLIVLYYVDPETGQYTEFSATRTYEELGIAKQGNDFFRTTYENSYRTVHPADQALFQAQVTKENILRTIERDGVFQLEYRLMTGELPFYVRLKASKVIENGKPLLIIGLLDEDAQIRHTQEFEHDLSVAKQMALRDALTGVKNKHAYVEAENQLNDRIQDEGTAFAIVVCDINNLKEINDNHGHKEGDRAIRKASAVLCSIFRDSPVFRVGGDEFAVICEGHDYEHMEECLESLHEANRTHQSHDDVQIAFGMARFGNEDRSVETVFDRADRRMYDHKAQMKMA